MAMDGGSVLALQCFGELGSKHCAVSRASARYDRICNPGGSNGSATDAGPTCHGGHAQASYALL